VSVIASSKDALVGVAHQNVTVFQRFFVEPDMPAKAYLGDKFPLKVQVYNYDDSPADVVVRLDTADWFTVVGARSATVSLNASEVRGVEFTIELTKVGIHELKVSGSSPTFTDNVIRPMRVKPAGERITDMFQGRLSPGNSTAHNLTILPQLIEGSMDAWAKLQGGVEAAVIEGADGFIHYVSGCGEQSLSTLSIDVLAFRTVREGGLDEAKLMQLEAIVTQGIAHELQYLLKANNGQGRGIVWFPGDQDVHPWLTAWGVITFKDARLAGFDIDPRIISDMQEWLKSQQKSDGSFVFPEWGIYEFNNPKLQSKTTATTAYVAHALVYSGIPASDPVIRDAIGYIKSHVEDSANWEDPYVLALGLKLLADGGEGGSSLATRIADRLHELRIDDNGTTSWGSPTNMISNDAFADWSPRGMWNSNPGFVIETTGYAAQALYGSNKYLGDVEGAVKFLMDHRSEFGTWYSTQDTVVAFQTVYAVSERKAGTDMTIDMLVDGVSRWTQRIDDSNKDLTFLFDLRPYVSANVTSVELRAQGEGFAMFQVFMEQWVPWGTTQKDEPLELNLTYDRTRVGVGESITAYASVRNHQDRSVKMALVELTAPVGMRFDTFQFEDLRTSGKVDNVEFEDGLVRLYINDLVKGSDVTFSYTLTAEMPAEVTLGGCRVFDMYNALVEMELPPVAMAVLGD
jgi:CD109 antigen